jgi:hypothetical protein
MILRVSVSVLCEAEDPDLTCSYYDRLCRWEGAEQGPYVVTYLIGCWWSWAGPCYYGAELSMVDWHLVCRSPECPGMIVLC